MPYSDFINKKIVAISNYDFTPQIESEASKYDIIIRFNSGSNENILSGFTFYNGRTDLSVLSGWIGGDFGNLNGFKDKRILFSRPKYSNDIKSSELQKICVTDAFEKKIKQYSQDISYIPAAVFYEFYDKYKYYHPTTGLICIYYMKQILNLDITAINFCCGTKFYNTFLKRQTPDHNIIIEKSVINDINITNILI